MFSLLNRTRCFVFKSLGKPFVCSSTFSHITSDGNITMVDVSEKVPTHRRAIAEAIVKFPDVHSYQSYFNVTTKKGDARLCAKLAGIFAAKVSKKKTSRFDEYCLLFSSIILPANIRSDSTLSSVTIVTC